MKQPKKKIKIISFKIICYNNSDAYGKMHENVFPGAHC